MRLDGAWAEGWRARRVLKTSDIGEAYAVSDTKATQDAIDATLALLDSPTPGMTVRLDTGEVFELRSKLHGEWHVVSDGDGFVILESLILALLRHAVECGAVVQSGLCSVVPGEGGE